jgi:antitoxin component YwqK of YwqJK toxin-antitoxin module
MKKVVSKFVFISILAAFALTSCEKELTRVVKQHHPTGEEKVVFFYDGEPSQETWRKAEIYYENGQLMNVKRYDKGKQNGWTESFYENGAPMAKIMYKDGEKIGHYWKKHKNGQIAYTGDYKENKRDGEWITMDENGDTTRIEKYEIGKLLKTKKFDNKNKD